MDAITRELMETGEKRDARGRRLAVRRHREAMIAAYQRSGLTQRAFAQRKEIGFSPVAGPESSDPAVGWVAGFAGGA